MEHSLLALSLRSCVLFSVLVLVCFPATTKARMVVVGSSAIDDKDLNPSTGMNNIIEFRSPSEFTLGPSNHL
jgi:hypothetical protein